MANAAASPDPERNLVGFAVGSVAYAVPIRSVREILLPSALTELPHAPRAVIGVADHRGDVVPIIDLRLRFGLPPREPSRKARWVLVEVEGQLVGLAVDAVSGVFGTQGERLRPPPALGGGDQQRGIAGVTTNEGRLTFVLDLASFEDLTQVLDNPRLQPTRAEAP